MSLDVIARHKGNSDIADGFLEIIRQLGIWIESLSGTNPDAGFDSFAASNYNHGNRSEQADLMEEVILRLQEINSLGPGGGGSSADNKIRVDAADTVSKTWDQLFAESNEIAWGKVAGDETTGKQVRLIAQLCFTAGQKAYVGGVPENNEGKLNIVPADGGENAVVIESTDGQTILSINDLLDITAEQLDPDKEFNIRTTGRWLNLFTFHNHLKLKPSTMEVNALRSTIWTTQAQVIADVNIEPGEIVVLSNGYLTYKPT